MKPRMKRFVGVLIPLSIIAFLITGGWMLTAGAPIDVLNPSGVIAREQRNILYLTVFLSALVVVPVFTMLVAFSLKYRASNKKAAYHPDWGENRVLELLWWGIPIVIIGVLGIVTLFSSHSLDPYKPLASDKQALEVQVVAMRWKWLFLYPQYDVATLNHVPVEVDRPIHFTLTADAPMSAFWVPKLGTQIYAMNGMQSELNLMADEVGSFTGYTTNINGEGYSDMKFLLKSRSEADFNDWLMGAKTTPAQMDKPTYDTLKRPASETDERTYRLTDHNLFATIVHERMGHSHQTVEEGKSD